MTPKTVAAHSAEARVRRYMCRLWTNFAKYGNPTPSHDESLPFHWDPVPMVDPKASNYRLPYLKITAEPQMAMDPHRERMAFWRQVYQTFNGGFTNANFER
ncbi:uncharacterized protein LOC125956364 [Anopheles darlingi]|uniref:uncharacterized protein LOC125956364 n=1 Tax=Anopheles darlingi TaxID=43151 RepID=UPI0020FFF805|nr:uncharacterized protein LOC125956364 [Anopheles darlingi]